MNRYYDFNSSTQQWTRRPQIDIRHPDGTVVEMQLFGGASGAYYATRITDPMDNAIILSYDTSGRLARIAYPNGVLENWTYFPPSGGSPNPWIEVTYTLPANPKVNAADLTWAMVFDGSAGSVPFATAPLWRLYYPKTEALATLQSGQIGTQTYDISGTVPKTHPVLEFEYVGQGATKRIGKVLHGRAPSVLTTGALTDAVTVLDIIYQQYADGKFRVIEQTEHPPPGGGTPTRVHTFTYSFNAGLLDTIVWTNPRGMETVLQGLDAMGRPTQRIRRSKAGSEAALLPRQQAIQGGEDANLDQSPNHAVGEPASVTQTLEYGACSACALPTKVTDNLGRITEATFDPSTRRVLSSTVPNPATSGGSPVTTVFTWVKAAGLAYTAEYLGSITDPDGTWSWQYTWVDRVTPTGPGGLAVIPYGKKPSLIVTTGPSGTSPIVTLTEHRDVTAPTFSSDAIGQYQLAIVGQTVSSTDGDGVTTELHFDSRGMHLRSVKNPQGAQADQVVTEFESDVWGRILSIVANKSSALEATYSVGSMVNGQLLSVLATVGGVPREQRLIRDRWGHPAVLLRSNKASSGAAPNDFGPNPRTDSARAWLRDEYHWLGDRLIAVLEDRRQVDRNEVGGLADAADARFLRTLFDYLPTGEVREIGLPNGAVRQLTWDGYGTLYKVSDAGPAGQTVLLFKSYVNGSLEPVSEFRGDASLQLWSVLERNAAGTVVRVVEPVGVSPGAFYTGSLGGARHEYLVDLMGRTTMVQVKDASGSSLLRQTEHLYDQLGRQYESKESVLGAGLTGPTEELRHRTFWAGMKKRVRIEETSTSTAGGTQTLTTRATETSYDDLARVAEVRSIGMPVPDKARYLYSPGTGFLGQVFRDVYDNAPDTGGPTTASYRTDYVRDVLGRILQIKEYGTTSSTPLVHSFTYYSTGATESHTDPMGKVQWFLPDARSRLVERFLPGTQPIWNGTEYRDWTGTSDRTELIQTDGRGRVSKTLYDFAGRPFVVMDPGAASEPTALNKNVAFARYIERDAASRVTKVFTGDGIEMQLHHDGAGRLLARLSPAAQWMSAVSFVSAADIYVRDDLGRTVTAASFIGPLGAEAPLTIVNQSEDSLGRLHKESFWFDGMTQGTYVDIRNTWNGGDPFRAGLEYHYGASSALNLAMTYMPDAVGRLSSVDWNAGGSTSLATYSYQGPATSKKVLNYSATLAGVTDFAFDAYGRHSKIETKQGTTTLGKVEFTFDAASNLTKEKYARLVAGGTPRDGDRFYYDEHHRLKEAWIGVDAATMNAEPPPTTPVLIKQATYGLDAANNRSQVTTDAPGQPTLMEDYVTDDDSHPSNRYESVGGQQYYYDERGNTAFDGRFIYVYDYLDRLSEVWTFQPVEPVGGQLLLGGGSGMQTASERQRYVVNNRRVLEECRRTALRESGLTPVQIMRSGRSAVASRLSITIPSGVATMSGGGSTQMLSGAMPLRLDPVAFYAYDAFERRTIRLLWGGPAYYYVYDGWEEASELVPQGQSVKPVLQSVWGRELDELLAFRTISGSTTTTRFVGEGGAHCPQWIVDDQGTVREQQQYDPYGATSFWRLAPAPVAELSASADGNAFVWRGHRADPETGLHLVRHRYYSASLGRFMQPDPLGVWGDSNALGNHYCYGVNNPLTYGDPFGLQSQYDGILPHITDPSCRPSGMPSITCRGSEDPPPPGYVTDDDRRRTDKAALSNKLFYSMVTSYGELVVTECTGVIVVRGVVILVRAGKTAIHAATAAEEIATKVDDVARGTAESVATKADEVVEQALKKGDNTSVDNAAPAAKGGASTPRPLSERIADFEKNPQNWERSAASAERATGRQAKGGVSIESTYRNKSTGETIHVHEVYRPSGSQIPNHPTYRDYGKGGN